MRSPTYMPTAPPTSAEDDAVGGQAGEADQRLVADGLDADDEVADDAADEAPPSSRLSIEQ